MTVTVQTLLYSAPSLDVQLVLLGLHALLWSFGIPFMGKHVFKPWIDRKKWKGQFVELWRRYMKHSLFIEFASFEAAYSFSCEWVSVLVQHALGGALCMPAVFPSYFHGVTPELAATLACHGALCEAGWELQDGLVRVYQVLFTKDGWEKNPPALMRLFIPHHTLGISMVVPMNLWHPMLPQYHELVFLLQFAGFVAITVQMYGYTLDLRKRSDMWQMKLSVLVSLVVMWYSRVIRYLPLAYGALGHLYSIGHLRMLVGGGVGGACMMTVSSLFLVDCVRKCTKFLPMPLPSSEAEAKLVRRASSELLASLSEGRHPASIRLERTAGSCAWAKLRAVNAVCSSRKKAERDPGCELSGPRAHRARKVECGGPLATTARSKLC